MEKLTFRRATEQDCGLVLEFIRQLAEYEKMLPEVVATEQLLHRALFQDRRAEVIFALEDGVEVGFALYFHNFSTFVGRSGLYLEDLFVKPAYRGRGYGKALLKYLAKIALDRGCGRFEWVCLDWNRPSIDFYRSLGAVPQEEWTIYRLAGDALEKLAE